MTLWEERAEEIKGFMEQGWTNRQIAEHYGVAMKTIKNQLGRLRNSKLLPKGRQGHVSGDVEEMADKAIQKHGHTVSFDADKGTHKSDLLLKIYSDGQLKDSNYLLTAHGYDPKEWVIKSSTSKVWNVYSKDDYVVTLYSSTITVSPKNEDGWTFEQFLDAIKSVKPLMVNIEKVELDDKRLLEVFLTDLHFGNSNLAYYRDTLSNVCHFISSRRWEQILFAVGSDLFHHDNFRSTTASGTVIQNADMPTAWVEAEQFYFTLVKLASRHANSIKVVYIKGNHDESVSYGFVRWLRAKFPDLEFDDAVKERKVHVFGRSFVGFSHGDKARKDLVNIFPQEFPMEWAATTTRELHVGDLHREDAIKGKDEYGIMLRTLSTKNKTDQWHEDNGYTTAHKRFMLFEYDTQTLRHIHYV